MTLAALPEIFSSLRAPLLFNICVLRHSYLYLRFFLNCWDGLRSCRVVLETRPEGECGAEPPPNMYIRSYMYSECYVT